ncbi:MAG: DNA-3-methyladenine glycosylase 2 family protein [Aquabacterium sp.]|nr:MAG: DNA-3-methyladenine glycosylase 2 family protein [Aquabacterium sp.]
MDLLPAADTRLDPDACYRAVQTRDARFDGRFFTAVRSTGIYCRPVCPARTPLRKNVAFYACAAAAQEAGFRPCLRCRPETAPHVGVWLGSFNLVTRALALIDDGALDHAGLEVLAERLGIGERQLRRLFQQHLGTSPVAVAQTRRVLLAKQLIHETRLGMTDVALAAGFGSVRRFNEVFQSLYGRPPAELRRLHAGSTQPAPGSELVVHLRYRPPYDWDGILGFLAARAIPGVEQVAGGRYHRSIAWSPASGQPRALGWLSVAPADENRLAVRIHFPDLRALPCVIARIRRVFDLAADPEAIAAHLGRDADLAPRVAARPGLRTPGAWDGFELAIRAVLGQQITVSGATKLAGKLVARHGTPLPDDDAGRAQRPAGLTHAFPEPLDLLGHDLASLGMPRTRGATLSALAAAAAADPQLFGPRGSLEETVARLRTLPGIGEWTAQYIAMRQIREPDAFPAADVGLMRALEDAQGTRPTPAQLLARAEAWRPWRAYAALYLWTVDAPAAAPGTRDALQAA